jgi:hypothetical protein
MSSLICKLSSAVCNIFSRLAQVELTSSIRSTSRNIYTEPQFLAALGETGPRVLYLRSDIILRNITYNQGPDKTIVFNDWRIVQGLTPGQLSLFGPIVADRQEIFTSFSAGQIRGTFGRVDVYPEWWGLQANNHDIAINCAVKASTLDSNGFGIKVSLSNRTYDVSAPIDLSSMAVTLQGAGTGLTSLISTTSWNATFLKADVWGLDTGSANHAAMIWIGGDLTGNDLYDARTYRCKVIGMTIACGNASFAHKIGGVKHVSGISSKRGWVEEGNAISDVTITSASGFGIGFCQHKLVTGSSGGFGAAVINGLSIKDFWIAGPTFTDAYGMYFSQWTNNCSVDTGTIDMRVSKSISSEWNTPPVIPTPPTPWIVTYPLIGVKAQGNLSLSNIHFEGMAIAVHVQYNSSGGNAINLQSLVFKWLQDPLRNAVHYEDGRSGADFANESEVTAANQITGDVTNDGNRYFGYGTGVLISKNKGSYQVAYNNFDRVTINGLKDTGVVLYLLRDAMYGKNIRSYGKGQYAASSGYGGISFYTRGNAYAWTTALVYDAMADEWVYNSIGATGSYDPANLADPANASRQFFIGPIF